MAPLLFSIHRLLLILILVQSASLYKIYALDDNRSDLLSDSFSSPYEDEIDQIFPLQNIGSDNEDIIIDTNTADADDDDEENKDSLSPWLLLASQMRQERRSLGKRSGYSFGSRSPKALPQRRTSRPHWNPLVAAYKRCGELSSRDERESCFKDAIQKLFVHKLRK